MNHDHAKSHVEKLGEPVENANENHQLDYKRESEGEFPGFYVRANFDIARNRHTEESHKKTTNSEGSTKIAFVLGDGDKDDHFVVDVFTDPTYGKFLFKTTSGQSLCIHEEGTIATAVASLQVVKSPAAPVLPDAQMVFQLLLQNRGPAAYRFELVAAHSTNPGNLILLSNGDTYIAPMTYALDGEAAVFTTITVSRGPVDYNYPALEIGLRLACEEASHKSYSSSATVYNRVVDGEKKIVFAQPCSTVFWAGLDDGYHLTINEEALKQIPIPFSSRHTTQTT